MIKIHDDFYCPIFEYLYLFVMVIYMAQMVPETGRMVGGLSGNPIPFLIPIILTFILLFRHPISFNDKRLWSFVGVMLCWSFAVCYKFHDFTPALIIKQNKINLRFLIFHWANLMAKLFLLCRRDLCPARLWACTPPTHTHTHTSGNSKLHLFTSFLGLYDNK